MGDQPHAGITLTVLVLLCVLGGCLGLRSLTSELPDDPLLNAPDTSCDFRTFEPGELVRPGDVVVSVFNAGTRSGQASKTLVQLTERGFGTGDTGNAPAGTEVRRAQVWAENTDDPAVRLVARQFGPKTRIEQGHPVLGIGIVVVVGDNFKALAPNAEQQVAATSRAEVCSPPLDLELE